MASSKPGEKATVGRRRAHLATINLDLKINQRSLAHTNTQKKLQEDKKDFLVFFLQPPDFLSQTLKCVKWPPKQMNFFSIVVVVGAQQSLIVASRLVPRRCGRLSGILA